MEMTVPLILDTDHVHFMNVILKYLKGRMMKFNFVD